MSRYLAVATAILTLIVIDQGIALHRLVEYSREQDVIISDYYNQLRHCDDVFEATKKCGETSANPAECLKGVRW